MLQFCGDVLVRNRRRLRPVPGSISLQYGWYLALLVSLIAFGAAIARLPRAAREPPGV
jgi:hypothetical protein